MKKILITIGTVILILIAINIITKIIEREVKDEYYDVMMTVEQTKLDLPLKTGEGMTLNNLELAGKKVKYFYKTDYDINNMSKNEIENYENQWKQNVINTAKHNPKNKSFVHENITFQYFLVDKNDKPLLDFEILPDDYQ
ncbi:hypothetical protein QWT87_03700 [Chryseobacterium sp. APV1]|uniref:Uncharacterized protein n=1 Tax=Chryseobacterium urinae TaxID=3058400 RepID=A0ABT8U0I9_9FLAO|nr:hypothetical protein [Chryseobacterium sp. APV1]MDO3423982.1 hypothetical protein [Chryseobacterium sp. APV1]